MFDITLRQWKDVVIDPLALLIPRWISPNQLTFLAFICGLSACLATAKQSSSITCLNFWLLNRLLDCLDGAVARQRGVASSVGGFWDLLSDFIIYSLIPISVAIGVQNGKSMVAVDWLGVTLLEASFHVNNFILFYAAAVAAQRDSKELTSVTMRPAIIEGFESGLIFTGMMAYPSQINNLTWFMAIAVTVGIIQRSLAVSKALTQQDIRTSAGSDR